ncbi:MAG: hypothetical protein V4443_05300 [Pseudomonadota bacterium]
MECGEHSRCICSIGPKPIKNNKTLEFLENPVKMLRLRRVCYCDELIFLDFFVIFLSEGNKMKRTALVVALFALTLTACGPKPAETANNLPTPTPMAVQVQVAAPATDAASAAAASADSSAAAASSAAASASSAAESAKH